MPEHFSFIFLREVEKLKLFNKAANSQKDFLSAIEKRDPRIFNATKI
jgi:hypothetical protein